MSALEIKSEIPTILVPVEARDQANGHMGKRPFLSGIGIEQVQNAGSRFVRNEGNGVAVVGKSEVIDVPRNCSCERRWLASPKVMVGQPQEFRILVGCYEEPFSVLAELAG